MELNDTKEDEIKKLKHHTIKQIRLIINHMLPNAENYDSIIKGIETRLEITKDQLECIKKWD
jgi:hypothetical protein